ncbi:MAG: tetratricopeptide repeat protein [Proteobacteria bacterium]|nr:tetratricopeptide repeat protein [Pseudomonadota bacterium]
MPPESDLFAAGLRFHQAGQFDRAQQVYRQILQADPLNPDVRSLLGAACISLMQWAEAAVHFRQILQIRPLDASAHFQLAIALARQGQLDAAIASYRQTLELKPDSAEACLNLANLLMRQAKLDEAIDLLNRAIVQRPGFAEAYANLGSALIRQGKMDQARGPLEQALRLKPELANIYNNLGVLHMEQCRFAEAIANFGQALARQEDDPESHHNLGIALLKTGDIDAAVAEFDRTLQLRPDYAEAHYNRAAAWLLKGDLSAGFAEHEWRFQSRDFPKFQPEQPIWDTSPLAGRSIALLAEQGMGDTLHFVRYASLVKKQAGKVFLVCPRVLHPLLARTPGVDDCVTSCDSLAAEICIPLLSLPHRFRTTLQTIPADVPYVFADPSLVASWREKIAALGTFKVGIAWQGNPKFPGDQFRSIPLAQFAALTRSRGVQLISLQKGTCREQLPAVAPDVSIIDFGDTIDTDSGAFMDTAAIMKNLDLVIAADTAVVHLAGALGVRIWVALPFLRCSWPTVAALQKPRSQGLATFSLLSGARVGRSERIFKARRIDQHAIRNFPVMPFESDLLATGVQFHQAGQYGRAQQVYRQILEANPLNPDALSLLGAACINLMQWDEAVRHLTEALRLNPAHAGAHDNLGVVLAKQNRLAEAVASFERAVALAADNPQTFLNLASAQSRLGRLQDAITSCRQAVKLAPDLARAHFDLAELLLRSNQPAEAAVHFRHVVRLKPNDPSSHFHLATALAAEGQIDAAIASYQEALRLKPASAEACVNLANLLMQQNKLDEAIDWLNHALRQRPNFAEAYINLGSVLIRKGRLDEASVALEKALKLKPDAAQSYNNLGIVRNEQGRYDEAIANYRQALARRPDDPETIYNLGIAVLKGGDVETAIGHFSRALELRPEYAEAHHNHAAALLLCGNYSAGLEEYEWRFESRDYPRLKLSKPLWDGTPLAGRDIVLVAEQGLGDTLQFIRYAPLVKRQAGKVIVECPGVLHPILARTPGADAWVTSASATDADRCVPLLSLPYFCRTTLATIPADVPYVFADPNLVANWREKLAALDGFKIGIVWQANLKSPEGRIRSVPLAQFRALAKLPGVRLISLQKGTESEQLSGVVGEFSVVDFGEALDSSGAFTDTAAIMQNLDLVITSDTAHLAGAMGVNVWVAIQFLPDWRWLLTREDSPWYPTMRLFRQSQLNDWSTVFARMASELESLVRKKVVA